MTSTVRYFVSVFLGMAGIGACQSSPVTAPVPPVASTREAAPDSVSILTLSPDHPAFFSEAVSFWAVAGKDTEGRLYFLDPTASHGRGEGYARFRVRSRSLWEYPDGRRFAPGDSVLITMRIVDPNRILLDMQPSGLRFSVSRPAELKIEYQHADPDYNQDGEIDREDTTIQHALAIWQQDTLDGPFVRVTSVNLEELHEIQAKVLSFSRFAIAY